jgi:protein SCO1/2
MSMRQTPSGREAGWLAVACLLASGLAHAQATATASPALPRLPGVMLTEPPRAIADFTLTDQDGRSFASSALRGRPALVFFGYAHCPDVCPAALAKLRMAHESTDEAVRRAQVVFVSVDGERDTPASLKEYLARLSPDFIGLTGDPDAVRAIAEGFHAAFYKDTPAADASYKVEHSGQIYLVDASGQLRAELYDPPAETITTLVRALP